MMWSLGSLCWMDKLTATPRWWWSVPCSPSRSLTRASVRGRDPRPLSGRASSSPAGNASAQKIASWDSFIRYSRLLGSWRTTIFARIWLGTLCQDWLLGLCTFLKVGRNWYWFSTNSLHCIKCQFLYIYPDYLLFFLLYKPTCFDLILNKFNLL